MKQYIHMGMALVYLLAAGIPAYQAIQHTNTEIDYLKKAYDTDNLQNNGAIKEAAIWKEIASRHHFLGPIIKNFFAPSLNKQLQIPPQKDAQEALDKIPGWDQLKKDEAGTARWWSLALLMISLVYLGLTIALRHQTQSDPLFALAIISLIFLVVGVMAPAMVLVVSPKAAGFPHFILHYEVRSIFGVISELYASSYWIIAVCLTVFSILIPLTKVGLTVFALETRPLSRKLKITKTLHDISKWSMADVFVAAILLSTFAVKSNDSMAADLFLGFYFFLSYCLLSMVTTTLLQDKFQRDQKKTKRSHEKSSKTKKTLVPFGRKTVKNKGL